MSKLSEALRPPDILKSLLDIGRLMESPSSLASRRGAPAAKPVQPVKVVIYGNNRDLVGHGPNSELILRFPSTVVAAILAAVSSGQSEVTVTL
jgi:hypothetical protein